MQNVSVDLRSYRDETPNERHAFVQIVLPVAGQLEIDVCGRQDRLSPSRGVLVQKNASHTQKSAGLNRSLVVDLDEQMLSGQILDKFCSKPFIDLSPRTTRLTHYMSSLMQSGEKDAHACEAWVPILIASLADENPDVVSRLSVMKALVEIEPLMPWSLERMADHADISVSRLHAIFRERFDETPHSWLTDIRMKRICALLATSPLPIAEIADKAGFSDQTALTRAMRKTMGTTPAAYRREFSGRPQ
ncbi:AraC family transcriptional regulator [Agrobacterium rosae]|uniref:AraC family transcriptional regulator n=1 Tax=Agrobacterium rosae TaxID=1972867 RepID=A0AAE5RXH5_9HYPH|nr:AraC family transcriptional regulator [Agrobacterium rosae]KAA3509886.1 AraC family transcriptional regulator [Agrobacterium rosae]KAA3515165.1 AraC family transcriptional regulator [Agrobacterium rosae]MCM2433085.1 helix-turn-helix transcriptional regulator [Agrobacterium rosae]MDX8331416.1 AraC family transcriptional regulator [Agrobacterium rosae]MQB50470.1 AraC family transcriptional regulator [Agrobacterium rosae]